MLNTPSLQGYLLAALISLGATTPSFAGVVAERTRVVFNNGSGEESLQLVNKNSYPVVVQAWTDDGSLTSTPDNTNAPILVFPPVFQLRPDEQRSLRLIYSGTAALPQDRESLFWLNVYEIPPKVTPPSLDQAFVTLALHLQYKVFYRPKGISVPGVALARALTFTRIGSGATAQLKIDNPTPYFATFSSLNVDQAQGRLDMVPPRSTRTDVVFSQPLPINARQVTFTLLDDFGNSTAYTSELK